MSVEIAWKQNILVTDFQLLKSLLVVFGFGSQAFVCGFSRQNICSADYVLKIKSIVFINIFRNFEAETGHLSATLKKYQCKSEIWYVRTIETGMKTRLPKFSKLLLSIRL